MIIYRFPGVVSSLNGANAGSATVFHCTNFSGVTENIRFVVRDWNTTIVANQVVTIAHLVTMTVTTKQAVAYADDVSLNVPIVAQGTAAIAATSINIICTAMSIDAAAGAPIGVALRGIRFSPVPGSQE